jgi:hypothetical protein
MACTFVINHERKKRFVFENKVLINMILLYENFPVMKLDVIPF